MGEITLKQDTLHQAIAPRFGWRTPAIVVAASGLVALCAHISIPLGFTPVPVTMQTFAVLLLGLLLSPGAAFASLTLYLIEGASGLPVFSPHGLGGIAQLLGPTGGYLIAYPFAAAMAGFLFRRSRRGFPSAIAAAGLASIAILAAGACWLAFFTHAGFSLVFTQSVAPFLAGDALKLVLAAGCAGALRSLGKPSRNPSL